MCLVAKIDATWCVWVPPGRAPSWYSACPDDYMTNRMEPVLLWTKAEIPPWLEEAARSRTFVAHNALGFDAYAYYRLVGGLQPEWYDTLPCARAAGLPGKLDALGERLTGEGKDEIGSKVMKMLTKAKWNRLSSECLYPLGTDAAWNLLLRYNVQDVRLLETVYEETKNYGEADVLQVDSEINSRGVAVDLALADALRAAWCHAEREAAEEVSKLTRGVIDASNIRSVEQVKDWIREQGLDLSSLDKNHVKRLIENPEELAEDADSETLANVVEVLKLRQVATSAAAGKLASLRESVRDGRAVDMLVYFGAHTGRWSGRGFQPQNLGRGSDRVPVEACLDVLGVEDEIGLPGYDVAEALKKLCPGIPLRDVLSTLTRPVFMSPAWKLLLIADYAAIEARGVAWVAGDEKLLDAFREGRDPYCEMAGTVFGRPITKADKIERHVGKTLVLGCGYGMSGNKYSVYAKQNGIDLDALNTTAAACVKAYRDRHKAIKQLWYLCGAAAMTAVEEGGSICCGRCVFTRDGGHLLIVLPSGRPIVYRNARVEMQVPLYCKMLGLPEVPKPTVVYEHPRGYVKGIYGGLICENIVQAICRDLLATALVRCPLPVVLHVHDEIVCEVPADEAEESLQKLVSVMVDPPAWAQGFPIGVEGFVSPRYVKSPFKGYSVLKGESK